MKRFIVLLLAFSILAMVTPFGISAEENSKAVESSTSKLGHIQGPETLIYTTLGDQNSSILAGTQYTNKVFYIKRQAELDGQLYYLISTVASDTNGIIGWVKSEDIWTQDHVAVDHTNKTFVLKGSGWAYTDAWGSVQDVIYNDLTPFKGQTFKVNLTEKVGSAIWYRGYLENGKKVWIQAHNVVAYKEPTIAGSPTSKLGHIQSLNTKIYQTIGNESTVVQAGTTYTNKVFYIKKQAKLDGQLYYLISTVPSDTRGVIGWVKSGDIWAQDHVAVDHTNKTFVLKGSGWAYTDAWGSTQDVIYNDLTPFTGQTFKVNLTERVGSAIWYRGYLENGKKIWIQAYNLTTEPIKPIFSAISKLGQIQSKNAKIYQTIGNEATSELAGTTYINKVFYIKKQAKFGNQLYYLISTVASDSRGVIGWVKSSDIWAQNHVAVDHKEKTFYLKGTGWAYTDAWGSVQDVIYNDLTPFAFQKFHVNLTEKVGEAIWYRGYLENGVKVWIQAYNVTTELPVESPTDKLGQVQNRSAKIYQTIGLESTSFTAGIEYTNRVLSIKRQTDYNGQKYYLISTNSGSTNNIVGWINSNDIWVQNHETIDNNPKNLYLKGSGWAYSSPWGSGQDVVKNNLTSLEGKLFKVTQTDKVGSALWYYGSLENGEKVWIQAYNVITPIESITSKLGLIQNEEVRIYETVGLDKTSFPSGTEFTNKVFYIKKQMEVNGKLFYLLSTLPSATEGVVGWINATDIWAQDHVAVDHKKKTFFLKGTGWAYTDAWGSTQDVVYNDLTPFKEQVFQVTLTEKVGEAIWYRGYLENGELVWIQANNLVAPIESAASKLGQIQDANTKIYETIGLDSTSFLANNEYTNRVLYIKKQAEIHGQLYYLLSTRPSITEGVVGWINAADIWAQDHVAVDHKKKTFFLKGTGWAYTDAWGSTQNVIYNNLTPFKDQVFEVVLTEKVGEAIWYRGYLENGELVWIQAHNVIESNTITTYTSYSTSFLQALNLQSSVNTTDKYRNQNAYISALYVTVSDSATITENGVRLRSQPVFGNNIVTSVNRGTKVNILGIVTGDLHAGSTSWYKISYDSKTLYVHSSLVNPNASTGTTTTRVNIREQPSESSHVFGTVNPGTHVNIVKKHGDWYEITYSTWRNAKLSDIEYYLNPANNDIFQHLVLSGTAGLTASDLEKTLRNKGTLHGIEQTFIQASKSFNVNEAYLVAHALHETGNGTSDLAKGIEIGKDSKGNFVFVTSSNRSSLTGIKKVYNMFGIAAYDSNPLMGGAKKAYNSNWTTPEAAVYGGAKWISDNYVNHPIYKQDTLYKMKFNPSNPGTHQYATDVGWAVKQVNILKTFYANYPNARLHFNIPRYQ